MDTVNHLGRVGVRTRNEKRCGQASRRYAEADRHLLRRACDGTGAARVFFFDVSEYQRIHARVLQRGECSVKESLEHDSPNRCSQTYRCKHHQNHTENKGVGDEDATIPIRRRIRGITAFMLMEATA